METGSGNFAFSPFNIYEFEKAFAFAFTLLKILKGENAI
jgi:hypothetical protein